MQKQLPAHEILGPADDLLTVKQVAARLQVSTKTVSRLIAKLATPIVKVRNQVRIPGRRLPLFMTKAW